MFLLFVLVQNHKIVQIYKKDMNLRLIRIQFIVGKNAVHAGFRWVNNGVLKLALVEMYKREYIFDKQKCIELLKVLSSQRSVQAIYVEKYLLKSGSVLFMHKKRKKHCPPVKRQR